METGCIRRLVSKKNIGGGLVLRVGNWLLNCSYELWNLLTTYDLVIYMVAGRIILPKLLNLFRKSIGR